MKTISKTIFTHEGEELEIEVSEADDIESRRGLEVLQFMSNVKGNDDKEEQTKQHLEYFINRLHISLENEEKHDILSASISSAIVSSHYYLGLENTRKQRKYLYQKALKRRDADIEYNEKIGHYQEADRLRADIIQEPVLARELHEFDMNIARLALSTVFNEADIKIILPTLKKIAKSIYYTKDYI